MLRYADDDDDESVAEESAVGRGARTEPMFAGRSGALLGAGGAAFVGGLALELGAPEAFVSGFEAESTRRGNWAESFVGGFAAESGDASQPLTVQREPTVPSRSHTPILDLQTTTTTDINSQSRMDNNPATNFNTTTDEFPLNSTPNADNSASASNSASQKQEKPGKSETGRKKKGAKNNPPVPSKSATPTPPEIASQAQDRQQTSGDAHQPGSESQNPTSSAAPTQDGVNPVQNTSARSTLGLETRNGHPDAAHGTDYPDGNPDTPPPPFKEVATPIEPTLLTQEQSDRESLRGEFLMRELKHLEMLVSKAESGVGRGSPSALSVERLNGIRERLVRVRIRVERRVYEGIVFLPRLFLVWSWC
jgi:hypothetical protein